MGPDRAVVVQPDQLDHVAHVFVAVDSAGGVAGLAGEDRVIVDASLIEQLLPDLLGEAAMEDAIAVQVPERPEAQGEAELASAAEAGLDAGPGGDLLGDPLARGLLLDCHGSLLACRKMTPSYKFKYS